MEQNSLQISLLSGFAVVFIAASGYLIFKLSSTQKRVSENIEIVSFAYHVEKESSRILSHFTSHEAGSINESVKLLDVDIRPIAKRFDLQPIDEISRSLSQEVKVNISGHRNEVIKAGLKELLSKSKSIIQSRRWWIDKDVLLLKTYGSFVFLLILISCVIVVLFVLAKRKVVGIKEQVKNLKQMKKLLLKNSIDIVVRCDKQGRITDFNQAAEKQFGYTFDEVYLKNVEFLYANKEQAQRVKEAINLEENFVGEILNRKKNGEIFVSKISANRVFDDFGKSNGSLGISRDITKQKELETNFETIVNNVADIVYSTDRYGNFTFINKAVTEMIGYTSPELIGKAFTSIIHKPHVKRVADKYAKQIQDNEAVSYTSFQVECKNGSLVWISQSVRLIMSETHKGQVMGFHGIARNVDGVSETPSEKWS